MARIVKRVVGPTWCLNHLVEMVGGGDNASHGGGAPCVWGSPIRIFVGRGGVLELEI